MKQPTAHEKKSVRIWKAGFISMPQLAKKLKKSKVGALSTIARVYKHE